MMDVENQIKELVKGFKESVIDYDDVDELVAAFSSRVSDSYRRFKQEKESNSELTDKSIIKAIEMQYKWYLECDIATKRSELMQDKAFDQISIISGKYYKIAKDIANGKKFGKKINTQNVADKLNELLKDVQPYNMQSARQLISETLIDVSYINDPNSEICSFRIGHILNELGDAQK